MTASGDRDIHGVAWRAFFCHRRSPAAAQQRLVAFLAAFICAGDKHIFAARPRATCNTLSTFCAARTARRRRDADFGLTAMRGAFRRSGWQATAATVT